MSTKNMDGDKLMVVLVIDDDPRIQQLVSDFIADSGFEVLNAGDADEAVHVLEGRDDIRAIFTDICMPGSMDGLKLAYAVRARWPLIRIFITSAYRMATEWDMPFGSRFFMKPYNPEHVVVALRGMAA